MKSRLNYKDDFEMLLFRHDYLKRVDRFDPIWLTDLKTIIEITAGAMFNKYYVYMNKVGLDSDDAKLLSQLFTIYYMSLYSLNSDDKLLNNFKLKFKEKVGREPDQKDIYASDRNKLINFIRQRFKHVNTICYRKSRDICGSNDSFKAFARTNSSINACEEEILADYKKYGYRKVTSKELENIKKKARLNNTTLLVDEFGFNVFEITKFGNGLSTYEAKTILYPSINQFNSSIDSIAENAIEDANLNSYKSEFKSMAINSKKAILGRFIKDNKTNSRMKVEVKAAREILRGLKTVVL